MSVQEVKFKGEPIEVKGDQPQVGQAAPDAKLTNSKGEKVQLSDVLKDKVTIISVIPNVLTRTCELQTKQFADKTKDKGYQYITVSRNSVDEFNQWNEENELDVNTYSDLDKEFGKAYGLDIDLMDAPLLARSVFVVDKDGEIKYSQIVPEVSEEPDYEPALAAADAL
ncbi:thiol peroxidase [Eremococcus coleocola]|uniref:Antioxidant, AhpC/TSA family n=1 Tax=Eremococcus coleocola ACS-139-V-Col8 TaxID=908337 RepID=E4KP47_9LACT|nr:redoxin domain-containing protein [Eremococcus coleocola]EFR31235.1 antioxidant, AhpC/TSA family [Eremococcus coleocola ACS-139-V-Col8]